MANHRFGRAYRELVGMIAKDGLDGSGLIPVILVS